MSTQQQQDKNSQQQQKEGKKQAAKVKIIPLDPKYADEVRTLYQQEALSTAVLRGLDLLHYLFRTHKKTKMSIVLTFIYILMANFSNRILGFQIESYYTLGICFTTLILILGWLIPGYQRFFLNFKLQEALGQDMQDVKKYYYNSDQKQDEDQQHNLKKEQDQKQEQDNANESMSANKGLRALFVAIDTENRVNETYGKVVGFIAVDENISTFIKNSLNAESNLYSQPQKVLEIRRICVGPEQMRWRGVGEQLVAQAEKWALENECTQIVLHTFSTNDPAIKLFDKRGYSKKDQTYYNHFIMLCGLQSIVYVKQLEKSVAIPSHSEIK